jgi:hypothetical protein
MNSEQLQTLIASRLEDMADQCQVLFDGGNFAEAELLREEGLALAQSFDNEEDFLYINDLKATR